MSDYLSIWIFNSRPRIKVFFVLLTIIYNSLRIFRYNDILIH